MVILLHCGYVEEMANKFFFFLLVLLASCASLVYSRKFLKILASGNEEVEKFATVITFYIEVKNEADIAQQVKVTPENCCFFIETDDVDCEVMKLRPPVTLPLGSLLETHNNSAQATFLFRNLYTRYRQGNCTFKITSNYKRQRGFTHTLYFNTFPEESKSCSGIDQDADRNCSQADCAIKYKGTRNFYRNSTGKCEPVVECNTRGTDGITVTGYYDWDHNYCHHLDLMEDNTFSHVESDTEIPSEIDPSQTHYVPVFEPDKLEKLTTGEMEVLQCNYGYQKGIYCVCDEGWMSSGIHTGNLLVFHWCDTRKIDPLDIHYGPRRLTKPQEISAIIALVLGNLIMSATWYYCSYKLCWKKRCAHLCQGKKHKYTALPLNEPSQ